MVYDEDDSGSVRTRVPIGMASVFAIVGSSNYARGRVKRSLHEYNLL
jgi:hypothetical protein